MASPLPQRLLQAEEDFLSALSIGHEDKAMSVLAFVHQHTTQPSSHDVDPATQTLAQAVAARMAIIADAMLSLNTEASRLVQQCEVQLTSILSATSSHELAVPGSGHSVQSDSSPSSSLDHLSHRWLLHNMHDPYPSNADKISIANGCGCTPKDVQAWFADVRRRIGWTALSCEIYGGSRRATVEAASSAYSNTGMACDIPSDVRRAFATIKNNACDLFSCGPKPTAEADGPDASLDLPKSHTSLQSHLTDGHLSSPSCYETPSPSYVLSDEDEDDTTPPPPIAGCKRRFDVSASIVDEPSSSCKSMGERPIKRCRHMSSLLSPASSSRFTKGDNAKSRGPPDTLPVATTLSVAEDGTWCPDSTAYPDPSPTIGNPFALDADASTPAFPGFPLFSRKRRLSDAAISISIKRPRNVQAGPRRQAVSDPLPIDLNANALDILDTDAWLHSNSIENTAELNHPLDIVLGKFSAMSTSHGSPLDSPVLGFPGPQVDVWQTDLETATAEGFDFSAFHPRDSTSPDFSTDLSCAPSADTSISSLSPIGSTSNSLVASSTDHLLSMDYSQDWNQLFEDLTPLDASPTSSQSSLSEFSTLSQSVADGTSSLSIDNIDYTLFGADPSFFSNLLSGISELSSLATPLEMAH